MPFSPLKALGRLHGTTVHKRRVRVIADHVAALMPKGLRVLDVGSGDGRIAALLMEKRPDLRIEGVDVLVREGTAIPTKEFDGQTLPHGDDEFDAVMMIDVLHHAVDPAALMAEAARVAGSCVMIKDHHRTGFAAETTLRFMDWVGNRAHGVALPYNYLSPPEWSEMFERLGLVVDETRTRLSLYSLPATWFFDRSLHFVARIVRSEESHA